MNIQTIRSLGLSLFLLCGSHAAICFAETTRAAPPIQFPSGIKVETVDESIDRLSKLIKQHPHEGLLYLSRAEYLNSAARYTEALRDANRAIELSSRSADAYKQRTLALSGLAKWQEALGDADRYVRMASGSEQIVAYEMRGCVELRAKKYASAIVDFNAAIQLDRRSAWLYLYRAWAFSGFGVYERTVKDCNKCLSLVDETHGSPDWQIEVFALSARAHAYDQQGEHELAKKDLKLQAEIFERHKTAPKKAE